MCHTWQKLGFIIFGKVCLMAEAIRILMEIKRSIATRSTQYSKPSRTLTNDWMDGSNSIQTIHARSAFFFFFFQESNVLYSPCLKVWNIWSGSFEFLFHRLSAASLMKLDQHLFFSYFRSLVAHKSSSNFFAYKRLIYCHNERRCGSLAGRSRRKGPGYNLQAYSFAIKRFKWW